MKPAEFHYERPGTLAEALALMALPDAAALAGGQSLMPMMNFRLAAPELLVDLGALDELVGVSHSGGAVRIGAMTRYRDLAGIGVPLIDMALPHVAHDAIRNRGTIGGSVALADPAAEMPAVLVALGAEIEAAGPEGSRRIPAEAFFLGLYETALEEGELVTAIHLPAGAAAGGPFGFHELARRHGDYAMAGVAIAGSRAVFLGVSDRPVPVALDADGHGDLDAVDYVGDLNGGPEFKRHLAGVVLRRAWEART